jgi:hypothetical protein
MLRPSLAATLALILPLGLSACGDETANSPDEVSPDEVKALEDAASMLDERQLPPEALPPEGPPEAPYPSAAPAEMTGDAAPAAS